MRRRPVSNEIKTERRNARIATLKSLIFPAVLCMVIGIGIFVIINYQNKEEEEEIIPIHTFDQSDQDVVMENDSLLFTRIPKQRSLRCLIKAADRSGIPIRRMRKMTLWRYPRKRTSCALPCSCPML